MRLAKPHLDVGIFTNRLEEQLAFWQNEVGLELEEVLPLGGGNQQYRHAMNGSVFKLNASREPMPEGTPTGYTGLFIARAGSDSTRTLTDPDGNKVTLTMPDPAWVTGIGVTLKVHSLAAAHEYYRYALGWEPATTTNCYRVGDTLIALEPDLLREFGERRGHREPAAPPPSPELRGIGYRYLTVQVWDVDEEHAGAVARGATEGQPPRTLGSTARISFLRDPDGNWLEVSQRASLTGPLPDG
jgi:catechol 2,3-dioxygenase-like lactoylglutathione lyase family enzyme